MNGCGAQLEEVLSAARQRVVLVAPFIKQRVMQRVLAGIGPEAAVLVYTRWRPDEVAAGVSDLGVFDEVRGRANASLMLCAELHAKYYRSDERVLVGSANLTAAALGWAPVSNLELLVASAWGGAQLDEFERRLALRSVPATAEIRDAVQRAADELAAVVASPAALVAPVAMSAVTWVPHTRHPEVLFRAYSGKVGELTSSGQEQALADLAALGLPPGLSEARFRLVVGAMLVQAPVVVALDDLLDRPRRFGEIRDALGPRLVSEAIDRDPSEVWQTLMRWLLWFLPHRYTHDVPRYSEIFARRAPAV